MLADDLESFLHYMPHGLALGRLTSISHSMFDRGQDGSSVGGLDNMAHIISGTIPRSGLCNHKITSLLRVLTRTVAARYEEVSTEQDDLKLPGLQSTTHVLMAEFKAKLTALETRIGC
jgi:hypothetical protein